MEIGERIKQIRGALKLNQEDFAQKVGAESKATVSNWERNRRLPNLEQLLKIAQIGSTTIDWLLDGPKPEDKITIADQMMLTRIKELGIESLEELDKFLSFSAVAEDIAFIIKEKVINYKAKKKWILDRWELPEEAKTKKKK